MILVDTSVWVDHLRSGNPHLETLLDEEQALCHPFVIGELACGNLRNRDEILSLLSALPDARMAEHEEVLRLLSEKHLHGQGLGWIDLHLLASARITACSIWTLDLPLRRAATSLKISAE
jgi:hypothetical protein